MKKEKERKRTILQHLVPFYARLYTVRTKIVTAEVKFTIGQ